MSNACTWEWDKWHNYYETSCDQTFGFSYCKRELEFRYCPYCGKEIKEVSNLAAEIEGYPREVPDERK